MLCQHRQCFALPALLCQQVTWQHLYHCPDQFRAEGCEALSLYDMCFSVNIILYVTSDNALHDITPAVLPRARLQLRRASGNFLFKKHCFLCRNAVFLVEKWFQVDLGSSSKKRHIFENHQNFDIFCDTFPDRNRPSRGPIELILSKRQSLI